MTTKNPTAARQGQATGGPDPSATKFPAPVDGALAAGLTSALASLNRWFEGRFVVRPQPGDEVVAAAEYLDRSFLESAIVRARSTQPVVEADVEFEDHANGPELDLRIAISRFTRQYCSSLTAVALVSLSQGVGLNMAPERCQLIIRSNIPFLTVLETRAGDVVRCVERPSTWAVDGPQLETVAELRTYVWRSLYGEHLAPLFARLGEIAHVSPNLMWSNAAEWVANVSDAADEYLTPDAARPYVDDRKALLEAPAIPGVPGSNPMGGLISWVPIPGPEFPNGLQTRRVCCITYFLPDRLGRLCQNCPFLPERDRAALVRERHGIPMSSPGGPATARAIDVGLKKLGLASDRRAPA